MSQKPSNRETDAAASLAEIAWACAVAAPQDEADLLRALLRAMGQAERAALLEAGGASTVALQLAGDCGGFMLSRGAGHDHLATVVLEGSLRESSAGGATAALALTGALAHALADADPAGSAASWAGRSESKRRLN